MSDNKFILMHESLHILISGVLAFLLWLSYPYISVVVVALGAGVLIDTDHLFDLLFGYVKVIGLPLGLKKITSFFYGNYMRTTGKIYVLLHSLEFIWVWWLVGYFLNPVFGVEGLQWAFFLPILVHILTDYVAYMPHPLAYFLFYRLRHKFSRDSFRGE